MSATDEDAARARVQAAGRRPAARRPRWNRRLRRRLRLHAGLAGCASLVIGAVAHATPGPLLGRLSTATAYAGVLALAVTLAVGPINILRFRPNPVSADTRRDLGIWAGLLGIVHTVFGLAERDGRAIWHAFVAPVRGTGTVAPRTDALGVANDAGLIAAILLAALLVTSSDLALRRLGRVRWKNLQRSSYVVFVLVVMHAVLYQRLGGRTALLELSFAFAVMLVLTLQTGAWLERRDRRRARVPRR